MWLMQLSPSPRTPAGRAGQAGCTLRGWGAGWRGTSGLESQRQLKTTGKADTAEGEGIGSCSRGKKAHHIPPS